MPIRLAPEPTADGVRLVLPVGRHLQSESWWVAAQVLHDKLLLRVWTEANRRWRVIVLDRVGSEHGSILTATYEEGTTALGVDGSTEHVQVEGRRLVSGGDRDWELAAEVHTIADEPLLYLRVWIQARQRFVLYAIDRCGAICDRATGDYQQAKQ
ncbi:MAG: hypothetical protein WBC33_07240, partial [Conexibacter sp.]